VSSVLASD